VGTHARAGLAQRRLSLGTYSASTERRSDGAREVRAHCPGAPGHR
jgi:hypothetical protein